MICRNVDIVMPREDVEVHLHVLQTMTQQSQLCECGRVVLLNCIVVGKYRLDHGMRLITQPACTFPCSNSAMEDNNGTNRILYHDINAQTITEPPPCFTVGTEPGTLNCRPLQT
jgi:hypothetical protein